MALMTPAIMVFCDFYSSRATLCGDRRGRGAKTRGFLRFLTCSHDPLRGSAWSRCKNSRFFAISNMLARPSAGIGVVEVQKLEVFLRFLTCSRDPLRGSAWSRCKNPWFFAISAVLARPSAGIAVVEVQKLEVFCDFCCSNWSCLVVRAPAPGTESRVRFLPGPRAGVARCNLHFKATCAEQLPVCAERLA